MDNRVPPNALDAERGILGGILLANDLIDTVVDLVKAEDFYSDANGSIFDTILDLHRAKTPADTVTLRDSLQRANKLQSVGGDEYVLALTDTIPAPENVRAYAELVREKALVRRVITAGQTLSARGYGDYGSAQEYAAAAEKSVFDAARQHLRSTMEPARNIALRSFERLQELARAGQRIAGLRTGFSRLDTLTAGMHPGNLIIVAGRPGMGKTALAMNIAVNAAASRVGTDMPATVGVFSLEMPKDELFGRMLASEARVDAQKLRIGQLNGEDWGRLAQAAGYLSDLPLFIDDSAALTLLELRAKARRLMAEHGLALIIVDYLQLMRSGSKNDSREQEISEISRSLKALAKELNIPVIALSQLNRGVESRSNKDKRPQLSDLRESGAIEQDADTIWFVYRDEVYDKESEARGVAEIIVGKQRSGPTGTVKVRFFNEHVRFDNLANEERDDE
ncbi:MAG TPA: replicative DNA helicase [Polyangiales bacterium]|nr:replicative DNA helicase [Polyangiales bacterium]